MRITQYRAQILQDAIDTRIGESNQEIYRRNRRGTVDRITPEAFALESAGLLRAGRSGGRKALLITDCGRRALDAFIGR
jgi:hypothetical protein